MCVSLCTLPGIAVNCLVNGGVFWKCKLDCFRCWKWWCFAGDPHVHTVKLTFLLLLLTLSLSYTIWFPHYVIRWHIVCMFLYHNVTHLANHFSACLGWHCTKLCSKSLFKTIQDTVAMKTYLQEFPPQNSWHLCSYVFYHFPWYWNFGIEWYWCCLSSVWDTTGERLEDFDPAGTGQHNGITHRGKTTG